MLGGLPPTWWEGALRQKPPAGQYKLDGERLADLSLDGEQLAQLSPDGERLAHLSRDGAREVVRYLCGKGGAKGRCRSYVARGFWWLDQPLPTGILFYGGRKKTVRFGFVEVTEEAAEDGSNRVRMDDGNLGYKYVFASCLKGHPNLIVPVAPLVAAIAARDGVRRDVFVTTRGMVVPGG